jgi:hypothetical protein
MEALDMKFLAIRDLNNCRRLISWEVTAAVRGQHYSTYQSLEHRDLCSPFTYLG